MPNATTEVADVVLPGASFAEKSGTFVSAGVQPSGTGPTATASDAPGRLQRIEAAVAPPGEARPEIEILGALLQRFGVDAPRSLSELFNRMASARLGISNSGFFGVPRTGLELGAPRSANGAAPSLTGPALPAIEKGQARVD